MFNLFPKKKSVDEILEDNGLSPLPYTNVVTFTVDGKAYTADEFIKHYKDLYTENENNKALLKSIEEDGTKEHNEAVKLRQENAHLKVEIDSLKNSIMVWRKIYDEKADAVDELMKEVNGLRHLKKENVDLIERVNEIDSDQNEEYRAEIFTLKNDIAVLKNRNFEILKMYNGMVTQGGLKYMEAKLQIVQNNYKKCAEERDEFKFQLKAANKEIEALKKEYEVRLKELHNDVVDVNNENKALKKEKAILERWKHEQLIVNEMWNKVDSYVRDHDDAPLGGFTANTCLNFLKERDELKANAEKLNLQITALHKIIEGGKKTIDEQKEEIKKLKEDIQDYVIEKDDKIIQLQKELDDTKAIAATAVSLCDVSGKTDYDFAVNEIKKSQDWVELNKTLDILKNMKVQGFEEYDPADFAKTYICNKCGYTVADNTNYYGGCGFCKDGKIIEKEKVIDWMTDEGIPNDDEQKHPMYPIHWGGWDNAPKSFPNEFQEETTAENLEEKFNRGEDILDYFNKTEITTSSTDTWQCPCNKCKDKRENNDEKTWEQTASDLALRVIKLEKQIEELKLIKAQNDPNYEYFLKHGKWPYNNEQK